jgi:hypothetical protein
MELGSQIGMVGQELGEQIGLAVSRDGYIIEEIGA